MSAASASPVHDIDTQYRIELSDRKPWRLVAGPASLEVENPEGIHLHSASITTAAAALGWKVDYFDFARADGLAMDPTRREAYSTILLHDYRAGGPSEVNTTVENELQFLAIQGFRATKQMGMTMLSFRLYDEGQITTEDPDAAHLVFQALADAH